MQQYQTRERVKDEGAETGNGQWEKDQRVSHLNATKNILQIKKIDSHTKWANECQKTFFKMVARTKKTRTENKYDDKHAHMLSFSLCSVFNWWKTIVNYISMANYYCVREKGARDGEAKRKKIK